MVEESQFPGEKLLDPSKYGNEEYLVITLLVFVIFVGVKHLIFHTFYFWWYQYGQFYIPNKFWSIVTGKSLAERVLSHVSSHISQENKPLESVLDSIDKYFADKEFAPSLGNVKGKILDSVVLEHRPNTVLVVGCHIGYCVLRILKAAPSSVIYVVEHNSEFIAATKKLLEMVNLESQVIFLCGKAIDVLSSLHADYGVESFDFVFLNRVFHDEPSHLNLLKKLEGVDAKTHCFMNDNSTGRKTVIVAEKVVMLGDPQYLKYVRQSDAYDTKYHQMSLEHTSHEIVDGMEVAIFKNVKS